LGSYFLRKDVFKICSEITRISALLFSAKYGSGYILGDFFTNSSGHPELRTYMCTAKLFGGLKSLKGTTAGRRATKRRFYNIYQNVARQNDVMRLKIARRLTAVPFEAIIMYAGKTAIIKPFAALSGRVTRLGEFSPIWQLFTLGS
jgi:hypothetical protein